MLINTTKLKEKLAIVKGALGTKADIFQGIDNVSFTKDKISSFNGVMSIRVKCDTGIEGCVHGNELLKLIAKFNGEETTLEHTEKGLKITNGRSHPVLAWHDNKLNDYLSLHKIPDDIKKLDDNFIMNIDKVLIKGNKSEACGVYIHDKYMFATNLNSVTKSLVWGGGFATDDVIIPQSVCEFIVGSGIDFTEYAIGYHDNKARTLSLLSDDVEFACNLGSVAIWQQRGILLSYLGGTLPSGKEIKGKLNIAEETPISGKLTNDICECVSRCSILSDKNNGKEYVILKFDKDKATVQSGNINGDAIEEVSGEWGVKDTLGSCFSLEALDGLVGDVGFVETTVNEIPYVGLVVKSGDLTTCVMPLCREWRG